MLYFHNLPDEIILKILTYSKTKDLISCGQLSKRIRKICHDGSLWVKANLEKKIVKAELLEMILSKGCRILNLSNSTIIGSLSSNIKSQLQILDLSQSGKMWPTMADNVDVLEELLFSCWSLQHLAMEGLLLTPKMVVSVCKNGKMLQKLNLNFGFANDSGYLQEIIKCCQELKEVDLIQLLDFVSDEDLYFLAKNMPPNVEKLDLTGLDITDSHVKILLQRCNKIKALCLDLTLITNHSLKNIRQYLNLTLEELELGVNKDITLTDFLQLKSMPRLKILKLYTCLNNKYKDDKKLQNLRQYLPHLMIKIDWENLPRKYNIT